MEVKLIGIGRRSHRAPPPPLSVPRIPRKSCFDPSSEYPASTPPNHRGYRGTAPAPTGPCPRCVRWLVRTAADAPSSSVCPPAGGVISYVGSCSGSPTRTSPVSMYSDSSNSQPCFTTSSMTSSLLSSSSSSSSGSAGEDGSSSASSPAGGSPRGRDEGSSLRASPSKSVASLTSKNQRQWF